VITTMPRTPIDDPWLATISVGLPVGLGIYYAWLNRGWPTGRKMIGFAVAVAAGLVGAWLGFHAGTDLLALITAIVGATAGANLTLLVFDISWERHARDRSAESNAKETLEAHPSTGCRAPGGIKSLKRVLLHVHLAIRDWHPARRTTADAIAR
jgi:hypothetical protein